MYDSRFVAHLLADTLVNGTWEAAQIVNRGGDLFGRRWRWIHGLAKRLVQEFSGTWPPDRDEVERFLLADKRFLDACQEKRLMICIGIESTQAAAMTPTAGRPESWNVPSIVTENELAEYLGMSMRELHWLADPSGRQRTNSSGRLRHYTYYWQAKRVGGSARLIEVPKWRLKMVQRRILKAVLEQIPVHWRAHGFCRGRSTKSFVEPHTGQAVVVKADLKDFFPSITLRRVRNIFRTAGYPFEVASMLALLCTNAAPDDVWQSFPQFGGIRDRLRHEDMLQRPHLPQGAPTSPALANLAAYRLDCRFHGLARSLGGRYTRYADDLLFSGGQSWQRLRQQLLATLSALVQEEGFRLNLRKTRVMGRSMRQTAAGLTMNRCVNIDRAAFDRLKALLNNCALHGPESQNRDHIADFQSHLNGRVGYVELINPIRGKRLRRLYNRIDWAL